MRKMLLLSLLSGFAVIQVSACDICGCGVGNFNPYLFPHLSRNFVSFNYQYYHYHTRFFENGEEMNNRERYNTFSIAGQYSPFRNLRLMAVVPFQVNYQSGPEGNKSLAQLGDLVFMANYKIFDVSSKSGSIRQSFSAGGGVKLATGKYQFDESNEKHVGNSNFQAGTGSTDYLLNGYYSFRYRNIDFSSGITYKINTANANGYRFGNRLLNVTRLKYIKEMKKFSVVPNAGVMFERTKQDKQDGMQVDGNVTGGYNTQLLLGIDLNTRQWAAGISYSSPIQQNLAGGQIDARPGLNIHLSYSF